MLPVSDTADNFLIQEEDDMKKRAIILAVITAMLTVNSGYAANTVSAEEMQKEESQASEIQAESGSEEATVLKGGF